MILFERDRWVLFCPNRKAQCIYWHCKVWCKNKQVIIWKGITSKWFCCKIIIGMLPWIKSFQYITTHKLLTLHCLQLIIGYCYFDRKVILELNIVKHCKMFFILSLVKITPTNSTVYCKRLHLQWNLWPQFCLKSRR